MSWLITPSFTQWTPADITTALWLDAADASTITASGGLLASGTIRVETTGILRKLRQQIDQRTT